MKSTIKSRIFHFFCLYNNKNKNQWFCFEEMKPAMNINKHWRFHLVPNYKTDTADCVCMVSIVYDSEKFCRSNTHFSSSIAKTNRLVTFHSHRFCHTHTHTLHQRYIHLIYHRIQSVQKLNKNFQLNGTKCTVCSEKKVQYRQMIVIQLKCNANKCSTRT